MMQPASTPWIVCRKPRPAAQLRLFCIPYAGGGASVFRTWPDELPDSVEVRIVQLPGRESRLREPPFTRLDALCGQLADVLAPHMGSPFAIFGYSLGALIAFELTRELRRRRHNLPVRLLAAARGAPQLPATESPLHALPDAELIHAVDRRYGGIPRAIMQEPELLQLLLPLLRADLAMMETYRCAAEEPLACPISVFGGQEDDGVSRASLEAWAAQTAHPLAVRPLPGGHFFLNTARPQLLQAIVQELGLSQS